MTALNNIRTDLHARFAHELPSSTIDGVLDAAVANHSRTAKVQDFVPVLAGRDAYAELTAYAAPALRIEFASRTNRALANASAAIARDVSKNRIVATVAPAHPENSMDEKFDWVLAEKGMNHPVEGPREQRTMQVADVVVYLGHNEDRDRAGRLQEVWDIPATDGMTMEQVRELVDDMTARIYALVDSLGISKGRPAIAA